MFVTYSPEGEAEQVWEFDPNRVRASDAEIIEKRYGDKYNVFTASLTAGDIKARRVLLWHLMRKQHHTLRFEDTPDFYFGELKVEHSRQELLELRSRIEAGEFDNKENMLAYLSSELAAARDTGEGKATSNSVD